MTLMGLFAGVALLLAASGVYGIMAFAVTQRTREIGVRMALGAGTGKVVGLVLASAMKLVALGVVVGLALATSAARSLESLLYETQTVQLSTYAAVVGVLVAVAFLSALVPALRAARVDPTLALASE